MGSFAEFYLGLLCSYAQAWRRPRKRYPVLLTTSTSTVQRVSVGPTQSRDQNLMHCGVSLSSQPTHRISSGTTVRRALILPLACRGTSIRTYLHEAKKATNSTVSASPM
ncbi:hypothetical protein PMIN06_002824 [Paraphaeosphaeria minitans]